MFKTCTVVTADATEHRPNGAFIICTFVHCSTSYGTILLEMPFVLLVSRKAVQGPVPGEEVHLSIYLQ
jgi:hypothetical protein